MPEPQLVWLYGVWLPYECIHDRHGWPAGLERSNIAVLHEASEFESLVSEDALQRILHTAATWDDSELKEEDKINTQECTIISIQTWNCLANCFQNFVRCSDRCVWSIRRVVTNTSQEEAVFESHCLSHGFNNSLCSLPSPDSPGRIRTDSVGLGPLQGAWVVWHDETWCILARLSLGVYISV